MKKYTCKICDKPISRHNTYVGKSGLCASCSHKKPLRTYCCKTCGNLITSQTALYRGGECKSCSRKGTKSVMYKGKPQNKFYGCIDCDSKISYNNFLYGNRRCRKCSKKGSLNNNFGNGEKISGDKNPCYGLKGKNHPAYTTGASLLGSLIRQSIMGRAWIRKCLQRDNFTCRECGSTKNLVVHHIKHFAVILDYFLEVYGGLPKETLVEMSQKYIFFWELNNGITLCEDCHKLQHKIG